MIGPVVCFSCNRRLSKISLQVEEKLQQNVTHDKALSAVGLHPVNDLCCRRMMLCQPQYWSTLVGHDDRHVDYNGVTTNRKLAVPRKVACV